MTMTTEDLDFCKIARIEPFEIPDATYKPPPFSREQAVSFGESMCLFVLPVVVSIGAIVVASYLIAKNL